MKMQMIVASDAWLERQIELREIRQISYQFSARLGLCASSLSFKQRESVLVAVRLANRRERERHNFEQKFETRFQNWVNTGHLRCLMREAASVRSLGKGSCHWKLLQQKPFVRNYCRTHHWKLNLVAWVNRTLFKLRANFLLVQLLDQLTMSWIQIESNETKWKSPFAVCFSSGRWNPKLG